MTVSAKGNEKRIALVLGRALLPLLSIVLLGSLGYHFIEGWPWFDSLYMTIITLTTVGYQETHPLSQIGKGFTLILLLVGIGNFAYVVRTLSLDFLNPLLSGYFKDLRMEQTLEKLKNHYIICGYGRIGRDVVAQLLAADKSVVVIDGLEPEKLGGVDSGLLFVQGDASHEEVLYKAGIERAKGLVSAVRSEAENVFITMTARGINAKLFIIARYEEEPTKKKLIRAGANRVINPYSIGSSKISQIILQPTVSKIIDFASSHEGLNLNFEEFDIHPTHPFVGQTPQTCGVREQFNVIIIAVEKAGGRIISNPGAQYVFEAGDKVVMIADQQEMVKLLKSYA